MGGFEEGYQSTKKEKTDARCTRPRRCSDSPSAEGGRSKIPVAEKVAINGLTPPLFSFAEYIMYFLIHFV